MTRDLPGDERDDESMDESAEPGAPAYEAAAADGTIGDDESERIEPAPPSAGSADVVPFDALATEPALSGEAQLPVSPEAQKPSADDARRALDRAIAEIRARTAGVELPPADDRPAIEDAFERRENFGTGRVEIGVHRRGEPAHAVKLSDEQSTNFDGAAAASTATLPVGGEREKLFRAPHVMLLVQLAEGRATYVKAVEEALDKNAPKYREIAESEVKLGFWRHENQRRAADWRLRGP